ncbi:transporter [Swaminathania salitolerans LMG 21291]|uniref:MFS transporter n=2 Tax=Swaminathania salitolerans TaxID=182838 RepID=A0A511BMX7_9PROT|nr:transporter [Swaminathania salitolerans LMG 21291]GEL01615.1 MFS transporter [Swaminathania salitolerans]
MKAEPVRDGLYGAERVRAMLAVALAVLLSVLDYAVANVALPSIAHDLGIASSQSIWVINAYQLASLSMLLPLASIGARIGFATMCRFGIALFVLASIFCALSHSLLQLALARALQGAGGGCIMSVAIALIRFIYPRNALGRGLSLNGLIIGTGVALGPTVGSLVLSVASWPWIFWINVPLGLAALLLARFALPTTPRSERALDLPAILLTIAAFTLTVIGIDDAVHGGSASGAALVLCGIACWAGLLRYQKGRADPVVPVDLLAVPSFLVAFIVGLVGFIASNFFIIAMPFTLETVFHRPATVTGFLITPWAVGVAVMSFLVGRWADRVPASLLSSFGLAVTGCGFALLWQMPQDAGNVSIAWRVALAGAGFGIFQPPNNRVMMLSAPTGREGSASGLVSVARLGGQTLGALLVASVFRFSTHASVLCLFCAMCVAWLGATLSVARLLGPGSGPGSGPVQPGRMR